MFSYFKLHQEEQIINVNLIFLVEIIGRNSVTYSYSKEKCIKKGIKTIVDSLKHDEGVRVTKKQVKLTLRSNKNGSLKIPYKFHSIFFKINEIVLSDDKLLKECNEKIRTIILNNSCHCRENLIPAHFDLLRRKEEFLNLRAKTVYVNLMNYHKSCDNEN